MNRPLRILGWTTLGGLLLAALLLAAVAVLVGAIGGAIDPAVIEIDGERIELAQLGIGHGLLVVGGMLLAGLIVLLVVPVAVLVPLLVVGAVGVGVLLLLAGVAALLFSPLIVLAGLVWLVWRMVRGSSATRRADAADATIAG